MVGKLLCSVGRHPWERHANPEASGQQAVYFTCRRCGKERTGYDPPTSGQASGFAGGGGI
jgi:hypothetical protein